LKYYISAMTGLVILFGAYFGSINFDYFHTVPSVNGSTTISQLPHATNGQRQPEIPSIGSVDPSESLSKKTTGNEIFEQYKQGNRHGFAGRMMLDDVDVLGIDKTAKNLKAVSDFLKSSLSNEEKVVLARILASFYLRDDANGWNSQVLDDLRQLAHSGDKELARAATLSFSRLGYFPDSESILLAAKNAKQITDQDYYGELTHMLPFASADKQRAIADTIRSGGDTHSVDILSTMLPSTEMLKKISPDALAVIKAFILEHEPKFPQAPERFGLFDVIRYGEWLKSVAALSDKNSGFDFNNASTERLSDVNTDPRKIIAFLISSDGDKFISTASSSETFRRMQQHIEAYAAQNRGDVNIQDIVSTIRDKAKEATH
jgi:hypothetical protein